MADLFSPLNISGMTVANRFIRSATWEGLANEAGEVTDRLTSMMVELCRGGVGLIITGHAYVSREGQASPWQLGVDHDVRGPGLQAMVSAVHGAGGRIVLQLAHGGAQAARSLHGLENLGPSVVLDKNGQAQCREAKENDLKGLVQAFAAAAARAKQAGFDGVELHAAHGYLLSEFLSPHFNSRTDEYGGSQEKRTRLAQEVVTAIRQSVGAGYPLMVKMNAADFLDDGLTPEQMLESASLLVRAGVDAIELSGGTPLSGALIPVRPGRLENPEDEAYYSEACQRLSEKVDVPVALVGGIRSLETAQAIVDSGTAHMVALSRPLIREPYLIQRWRTGDTRPALCESDNGCFRPARRGEGLHCTVEMRATGRPFVPWED